MKNKPIIIILAVLFFISTTASILGLIRHNKNNNEVKNNEKPKEVITYEYYLENEIQKNMPTNDTGNDEIITSESNETEKTDDTKDSIKYIFSKYQCDNGITGTFNEEEWEFTPNEEKTGICKLYFVKAYYEVSLTAANGVVDEENDKYIARETDGQFKVTPNEGYIFKEVTCSNKKNASYDISTNTLSINVIMEDVACKVDFEIKNLNVNINVKNGVGTTTENANYGESISAIVTADDGYENPSISCSNNQKWDYSSNKFSIEKLTNDTTCDIEFVKTSPKTYKLTVNVPEEAKITSGSTEQNIVSGKDGKFSIKPDDGYEIKLDCGGVVPIENKELDGSITYTLLGMTKDVSCNVTANKIQAQTTN